MVKILITGANGYIGQFIVSHLRPHYYIVGIDLHDSPNYSSDDQCMYEKCDIRNLDQIDIVFKTYEPTLIIHLAALISVPESFLQEEQYYQTNVQGTRNIIQIMKKYQISQIIFSSTCAVFDDLTDFSGVNETHKLNPRSPYALQKRISEEDIVNSGLDYVIFRFFNVVGGKLGKTGSLFSNVITSLKSGTPPIIYGNDHPTRDGTTIRDYIHPLDLAIAHELVISKFPDVKQNFFNLGSGQGFSTKEIVVTIAKHLESSIQPEYREKRQETVMTFSDSSKAKEMLGWSTKYTLDDIIKSLI